MAESIIEKVQRESAERTNRFDQLQAESKARLRFAWVQLSPRKYMVIWYQGGSYKGDWEQGTGRFDHRFKIVATGLSHVEKEKLLDELIAGTVRPEDVIERIAGE